MELYQYIIIIAVLVIIALAIVKMNKKDLKLELNKLVELLGGKDNILDTEVEMSRFKVTLKDITKANKEAVGVAGRNIVEIASTIDGILKNLTQKMERIGDGPDTVWKSASATTLKNEFMTLSSKFNETYEAIRTTGEAIIASKNIMEQVEQENNTMM